MLSNTERLKILVNSFQRKWGGHTLERGTAGLPPPLDPLSTGFAPLDALLRGGVPRSTAVEILGRPTSGATTLALNLLAGAQALNEIAIFVDFAHTFDSFRAEACGVDLDALLIVRPRDIVHMVEITEDLIRGAGRGAIVINHTRALLDVWQGASVLARGLKRIATPFSQSNAVLLFLTLSAHSPPPGAVVPAFAALRVALQGRKWLRAGGDIMAFESTATLLKSRQNEGQSVVIRVPL